jgi:hypothetical protein
MGAEGAPNENRSITVALDMAQSFLGQLAGG